MTSRMKWLNASTSNALVAAALGGVIAAGCAHPPPSAPAPLRGTVDLDALERHHPGWSGVGQYDAALQHLKLARRVPESMPADAKMASLPALASLPVFPPEAAPESRSGTDQRLETIQYSLISSLRRRRQQERREQERQEREVSRQEASRRFTLSVQRPASANDVELQLLEVSIVALTNTVANWNQSIPPTPRLNAIRRELAQDKVLLETHLAARTAQQAAAATAERDAVQGVADARKAYVRGRQEALEARLAAEDNHLTALQDARLTRERTDLLAALFRPDPRMLFAGNAGPVSLPREPEASPARLSQASLTVSEGQLRAQRARWLQFLRDDTAAAARDTAQNKRWDITFGPPHPGERDLTADMIQALDSGLWRL